MNEKEMVGIGLSEWKSCVLSDIAEVFMGQAVCSGLRSSIQRSLLHICYLLRS